MKFCSDCGSNITHIIPDGDNRPRFVCDSCNKIHYQNPRIIAGCLPLYLDSSEEKVLLCKRAIDPRKGLWTLPAGFLENGETVADGALRETREEANANAEIDSLYTVFSLPHISQAYMFFRARLLDLDFSAGHESLDVQLFAESEIPWDELAFPVITQTLEHYFEDRKVQQFGVYYRDIFFERRPG
ncbi:MAG TPA: NUDIX hydrolase [Pseudomonadales bacterium]|jgi:ADP-ribose pyrophosphatase YjhB (NUDIX family)|nr:NUDIX hydrolase [Gammaproteobacteria bacterium]MDP6025916.1 NUDIX hydrolase [Pseudomonadales bacterium]MDP6316779.1 NUDIX hydrolase [Pseudomonadales bacterium]MDP7314607.1 NUDIX hydrolase [Pseudomonadales bacterium]MDP7575549.1 NUDIX hydrolase [Pseudomonadales bacterium]|tara:strand:- start:4257 stop:4814 length:558 start_codon:yes stop_codon:yes gene_type:complete